MDIFLMAYREYLLIMRSIEMEGDTMIRKNRILSVLALCFLICVLCTCRNTGRGWAGSREMEGDILVIHNPEKPLFGALEFEIEQDLSIGNDEDENFRFFRANDVDLDARQNIYLLDSGNGRVQKFAPDGSFLQSIGKKGRGPGELDTPLALFIGSRGQIHVAERQNISIFSPSGIFQSSIPLDHAITDFCMDDRGRIIASGIRSSDDGTKQVLIIFDSSGRMRQIVREFSDVQRVTKSGSGAVVSFKAYHQYSNALSLAPAEGGVFFGYSSDYRIFNADGEGKITLSFSKKQDPEDISRGEKDFIVGRIGEAFSQRGHDLPKDVVEETCQFPSHRPFFRGLELDERGRIYVALSGSVLQEDAPIEIDIFSEEGYYLYRTSLPFNPDLVRAGYAYDIFTSDETGEVSLRRYRILNWDQIKTEAEF